jgi:hypothetical protein
VEFLESDAGTCFVFSASRKIQEVISNRQVQFKSVFSGFASFNLEGYLDMVWTCCVSFTG